MNFSTKVNTGNEGIFWLKKIKELDQSIEVIMLTAFGDVHVAVNAMKEGASDFVLKPWDNDKLTATLKSAVKLSLAQKTTSKLKIQKSYLEEEITRSKDEIIGKSPAFVKVLDTIAKVAPTDANVLITGENGTGKSLLARELHLKSNRKNEAFVTVDLGSLSESLFESELFGYKKGAFTDAKTDKPGRMSTANGGTLFLDEIGNLSPNLQMKLLAALQEKKITQLGSNQVENLDIRLVTATNQPLNEMIARNEFREDLFYRINTITLEMPALRNRIEDIEFLAQSSLHKFGVKYKRDKLKLTPAFIQKLKAYDWPGNIRELEHLIEKCVILSQDGILTVNDLDIEGKNAAQLPTGSLEEIEKQAILAAIKKHNGNMIRAARELSITRQTIYNKMKKYGL
jgi:DNA-binding NtrC family response regulator